MVLQSRPTGVGCTGTPDLRVLFQNQLFQVNDFVVISLIRVPKGDNNYPVYRLSAIMLHKKVFVKLMGYFKAVSVSGEFQYAHLKTVSK